MGDAFNIGRNVVREMSRILGGGIFLDQAKLPCFLPCKVELPCLSCRARVKLWQAIVAGEGSSGKAASLALRNAPAKE